MPLSLASLAPLLGREITDTAIETALARLAPTTKVEYEEKTYPDATYRNYYALGLSLCFLPKSGSQSVLVLDSIDIFNSTPDSATPKPRASKPAPTYAVPPTPLVVHFAETELVLPPRKPGEKEVRVPRPPVLDIELSTTAREIVRRFGEPTRKGAGGWVGVWLEWGSVELKDGEEAVKVGIMLEMKDPKGAEEMTEEQKKKGMGGLWDRAAFWRWGSIKVFRPTK